MIGRALRLEIERYATRAREENMLFVRARDGALGPRHMLPYLRSIHFLVSHTPIHLRRAAARAAEAGDSPLAEHYLAKITEEAGHDAWAERDVRVLSERSGMTATAGILPAMRDLVDFLAQLIDRDPSLYLAYILFAEYFLVLLGPEWLALLEERCSIPRSAMSVVSNHVELDKSHVEHALEEIDDLVGDPKKLPRMREALLQSMGLFDAFCAQVTTVDIHEPIEPARRSPRAVSAA